VLLVEAVEERTNMTVLTESPVRKLLGLRGGLHILTSTQRSAFWLGGPRFSAAQFDLARSRRDRALGERAGVYGLAPPLSTGCRRRRTAERRQLAHIADGLAPSIDDLWVLSRAGSTRQSCPNVVYLPRSRAG
jgi:hypothetical protein